MTFQGFENSDRSLQTMSQGILNDITPLMKDGAISRIQYIKQQQDVRNTQKPGAKSEIN